MYKQMIYYSLLVMAVSLAFVGVPVEGVTAAMLVTGIPATIFMAPDTGGGTGGGAANVNNSDPKKEFANLADELKTTIKEYGQESSEAKSQLEKINNRMDELEFDYQAHKKSLPHVGETKEMVHLDTFRSAFFRFASGDRHAFKTDGAAGLEVKSGYHPMLSREEKSDNIVRFDVATAGALLLPEEIATAINYNVIEKTPVMELVLTSSTSRSEKSRILRDKTGGGTWLEEEGTNVKKKPEYRKVKLTPKKFAARYGFTIEQQEDTAFDLVSEISRAYQEDFDVSVGSAVVKGDGNGKPKGMIGNIGSENSGALTLTAQMLIDHQESLLEAYQNAGSWLFTRKTRAFIRGLFLSSANASLQYLWEPDFTRRAPTMLLGNPVYIAREGDLAGATDGTFIAGEVPVIYGDFREGYEVTMRTDMYIIDDPYSESDQFVRNLNIMSRVDGQPTRKEALSQLTITSS